MLGWLKFMNTKHKNTVILGYHSPSEWVFTPEAMAIYNDVIINKEVVERIINEGHQSASKYRVIKSEIVQALIEKGILKPLEYPLGKDEKEMISKIVDYQFMKHEEEMRDLLIYAYDTFIKHEEATLRDFVEPDDPYWKDITIQLFRLKDIKAALQTKEPIKDLEKQKNILCMYFEDAILTPKNFLDEYNPVFQWEGYAKFEQYLLKYRRGEYIEKIKKGSEYNVLSAIANIVLPCRNIQSSDEIDVIIKKWDAFSNIRKETSNINHKLWEMVTEIQNNHREPKFYNEFEKEFDYTLGNYVNYINHEYIKINKTIEKAKSNFFARITKYVIATIGSLATSKVNFSGGMRPILDDVYNSLIERNIKNEYPSLKAIFEYEHIISNILFNSKYLKHKTILGNEYNSVKYWDMITS